MKNTHINVTILSEINSLLLNPEIDRHAISSKLRLLEDEIQELLKKISNTTKLNDAETEFKKLDDYQLAGAKLYFKHNFKISRRLEMFIKDFDRLDDLETRKNLFGMIKTGKYF